MTYFLGSSHFRRFMSFLPKNSDSRFFVKGGACLVGIQQRDEFRGMVNACTQRRPENIIVHLGDNDISGILAKMHAGGPCCHEMPNAVAKILIGELRRLILEIRNVVGPKPNIYIVDLLMRQKLGEWEQVRNLFNGKLGAVGGVRVIRFSRAVRRTHLRQDGVHITDAAYIKLARYLAREVPTM